VIASGVHYLDGGGGADHLAYQEALYLARLGHEVWLLGQSHSEGVREHEVKNGVHLLRYQLPIASELNPRRLWRHQVAVGNILAKYVCNPVHALHGHAPLQFQATRRYSPSAATCYSVHSPVATELKVSLPADSVGGWIRRWVAMALANRVERDCIARSQQVTVESHFTKGLLQQIHGKVLAERINIVPGGADVDRFRVIDDRQDAKCRLGWPTDKPVLFTLRRLVPRMGLDRLLRAARRLADQGHAFQLVIGGAGPLRSELDQLAMQLDLGEKVCFLGYVQDADLPLMYGACDAFVLPTAELECFGLIAVEALACGRPVLATPVGAIPEILNCFEPKWLSRGADVDSIYELVSSFLLGKLPVHCPQALRSNVEKLYSSKLFLSRIEQCVLAN
jgi:glycosyltransferase involved in cell wall biosynthesis